ncbi:MAG: hypothetical protein NTZ77_03525 [Caldiserica bacterium]|jgi:hypothetical protein|nr:hypothetical protein [Caldisericota bacterium]
MGRKDVPEARGALNLDDTIANRDWLKTDFEDRRLDNRGKSFARLSHKKTALENFKKTPEFERAPRACPYLKDV